MTILYIIPGAFAAAALYGLYRNGQQTRRAEEWRVRRMIRG